VTGNRISSVCCSVKNGFNFHLFIIMARKRKSDDMNVVAPDRNEKSAGSGRSALVRSDHYQNIF